MGYALQVELELQTITCGGCFMTFAIPATLMRRYRQEGISLKCPNSACPWGGMVSTKTENAKLAEELEEVKRRLEFERLGRQSMEREAEKERRKVRRLERRARGGACPCCNRSFVALARHMKSKHPEFAAERK